MADVRERLREQFWGIAFARDRYLNGWTSGKDDSAAMEMSCAIGDLLRALEKESA